MGMCLVCAVWLLVILAGRDTGNSNTSRKRERREVQRWRGDRDRGQSCRGREDVTVSAAM